MLKIRNIICGMWTQIKKGFSGRRARLLPPWITALSLSVAGGMGIFQYCDANHSDRVLQSTKYYDGFVKMNIIGMSMKITQGRLIDKFWERIEEKIEKTPSECENLGDVTADTSISFGKKHKVKLYSLLDHYNMVIQCGLNGACDAKTVHSLYARDMREFSNAFCHYFKDESCEWREDQSRDAEILRFIDDSSKTFACDYREYHKECAKIDSAYPSACASFVSP